MQLALVTIPPVAASSAPPTVTAHVTGASSSGAAVEDARSGVRWVYATSTNSVFSDTRHAMYMLTEDGRFMPTRENRIDPPDRAAFSRHGQWVRAHNGRYPSGFAAFAVRGDTLVPTNDNTVDRPGSASFVIR